MNEGVLFIASSANKHISFSWNFERNDIDYYDWIELRKCEIMQFFDLFANLNAIHTSNTIFFARNSLVPHQIKIGFAVSRALYANSFFSSCFIFFNFILFRLQSENVKNNRKNDWIWYARTWGNISTQLCVWTVFFTSASISIFFTHSECDSNVIFGITLTRYDHNVWNVHINRFFFKFHALKMSTAYLNWRV